MNHESPKPLRVLYYDLETTPILIEAWKTWQTDAIRVRREWYLLSFAYKWKDQKTVNSYTLADFKNFKKDITDDSALIAELYELFNEADVLIAHNGDRFDQKKAHARFIFHGHLPPQPYMQIDTLKVAKKYFSFTSNRLDDLGNYLGVGRKQRIHPDVWEDCMNGDQKAFEKMKRYNKQDVLLLERVYMKLRPWIGPHPSIAQKEGLNCPRCDSKHLITAGWKFTGTGSYRRFVCKQCGGYVRSKNKIPLGNLGYPI